MGGEERGPAGRARAMQWAAGSKAQKSTMWCGGNLAPLFFLGGGGGRSEYIPSRELSARRALAVTGGCL